jgi:hypothetical protein
MTAVLAMLYLTLMASLALGFYSATNTAVLVSTNEQCERVWRRNPPRFGVSTSAEFPSRLAPPLSISR